MLTTREAIALKIETTYRTDATPSASADALLVSELSVSNEGLRMLERNNIKPTISTDQMIFAGTLKKITFTAEIKGSGAAGTAPEIGQALRACGLDETVTASTSVAYKPVSQDHESATIYYYQDGRLQKLLGCRGTFSISAENASYGAATFEFTGHDGGLADASFPALSYDSTVPVPFMDINFQLDSYGPVINSFNMDVANTVVMPGDVRDEYGFGEIRISKRDPNGSIDPEAVLLATKDFQAGLKAGTRFALNTGEVGKVTGNKWRFAASIALRDITQGDREQIRTDELAFGCHETSTDDEFTLTFL